jgi:hypothetical protein
MTTDLISLLRQYADIAEAGQKPHWASAMRRAASDLTAAREQIAELTDKALRYDLDQAGIAHREREAIELVESRERVAELEAFAESVECQYDDDCTPGQLADRLYDVSCRARALLSKEPQP